MRADRARGRRRAAALDGPQVNAALIAMGKEDELVSPHCGGFLHQGYSKAQFEEMCLHLAHYSGWPTAVGGRRALSAVLKAQRAKL